MTEFDLIYSGNFTTRYHPQEPEVDAAPHGLEASTLYCSFSSKISFFKDSTVGVLNAYLYFEFLLYAYRVTGV